MNLSVIEVTDFWSTEHFLLESEWKQEIYWRGHHDDLSNSGEFKRQTARDNAVYIHSFLRYYSDTQSVSSWFYKETEIKI